MNAAYPLALDITIPVLWLLTIWQSHRLFYAFREKYPKIASAEIPYAFDHFAHPEKALFFFRKRAADILRPDPALWSLRRRVIILSICSVIVPPTGFGIFMVVELFYAK